MPTKPVINPSKKLKNYQWKRLLHEPKDKKGRVHLVWDDIQEVNMDIKEVEDLFEDQKKVKVEDTPIKSKTIKVKKSYFDADTSLKMSIVLKRLPKPQVTCEILTNIGNIFYLKLQMRNLQKKFSLRL